MPFWTGRRAVGGIFLGVVLIALGWAAVVVTVAIQAAHDEATGADAIVVLGAAQYNGRPSPVFRARLDHAALSDDRLTVIARNREATALYAWEPYFHNPKLKRWLHRISVPTLLLWGADDRFVTAAYYGAACRGAIPGARFETIDGAGHFPHIEEPRAFAERVRGFLAERKA